MCFGGPKTDNSIADQQKAEAAAARQAEEARQARIKTGTAAIDKNFAGFDTAFFDKRNADFMSFYQPQVDDQFKTARDNLTFALNDAGLLNSSVAGQKDAELQKAYGTQRATIQSKAAADTDAFNGRVQNEKSALVSQLNATGDADRAANEATSRTAQMYQTMPDYSPLGDLFAGLSTGIGSYANRVNNDAIYSAAGLPNPRRPAFSITA